MREETKRFVPNIITTCLLPCFILGSASICLGFGIWALCTGCYISSNLGTFGCPLYHRIDATVVNTALSWTDCELCKKYDTNGGCTDKYIGQCYVIVVSFKSAYTNCTTFWRYNTQSQRILDDKLSEYSIGSKKVMLQWGNEIYCIEPTFNLGLGWVVGVLFIILSISISLCTCIISCQYCPTYLYNNYLFKTRVAHIDINEKGLIQDKYIMRQY